MATIMANGLNIAYESDGKPDDPCVLLVMGMGLQLISWPEHFVEGLVEQGYRVVRFDNRDSGLSSKMAQAGKPYLPLAYVKSLLGWPLKTSYTLDDMADDALGLLAALGVDQAHVIGVSMGGMIAQVMAARAPQQVLSLTSIMSSSGRRGLPGPTRAARNAILQRPKRNASGVELLAHMAATMRAIGSPAYPVAEKLLNQRIEAALQRSRCPEGEARQMLAIAASGERTGLLASIRCPALVIHGAHDPLIPLACGIDTAALIPGAQLEVIEGMGHDMPPQLIERLLALIDVHLQGKMVPQIRFQRSQVTRKKLV
ncbi:MULTISPECIES: alpha/beta hydrolase [unclassified Janthinobacterium]|uniref:alpha/beta fold hydrolase n=1 Tax=unclassified Janthinobacterium TaxID=2610881 RepID=UPI0018C8EBCC|nr:alpha/beta hydrolase [Janthinobacterium sp. CG_23.4]MDH6157886.1 proline iminopeptidase [Janthinobacterium sp. CG_23.4]